MTFLLGMFAHIDDELTKLTAMGIDTDAVLTLVSGQVIHIYESLFDVRQHAKEMSATGSKVAILVSTIWHTMEAHQVMGEYMALRFKHHPAISSAYVRFLTKMTGDNSAAALTTKFKALEKKHNDLKGDFDQHVKVAHNRLESKVEVLIKANDLKRK